MANEMALTTIILLVIFSCEFQNVSSGGAKLTNPIKHCTKGQSQSDDANIVMKEGFFKKEQWSHQWKDMIAAYALKGKRAYMEDRYAIKVKGDYIAFAVFDGHGGKDMAKYAAKHLLSTIIEALKNKAAGDDAGETISHAILQFNEKARSSIRNDKVYKTPPGSTVVLGVMHGQKLYIANVGDSRAIAIRSNAVISPITRDHKASDPDECNRLPPGAVTNGRVGNVCLVSRALGNYDLERHGMKAEADIFPFDLEAETLEYIVLATDGVWDKIPPGSAGHVVLENIGKSLGAEDLAKYARSQRSTDNITAMVVNIAAARAWMEKIANRREEC